MPRVSVDGVQLYYEQEGKGHPLVLISGYGCDSGFWQLIRKELARHFSLLMFDNRGMGRSDLPEDQWTIEQMADETIGLADALGIQKPHILGHSMGGAIAQAVAYRHGDRINKAVFAQTLLYPTPIGRWCSLASLHLLEDGIPAGRRAEVAVPWLFTNTTLESRRFVQGFVQVHEENPNPPSLDAIRGQYAALDKFDSRPWCSKITTPSLVLCGDQDLVCPPNQMYELAEKLPHGSLHVVPGCAHVAPVERPAEFCRIVKQFLAA